MGEDQAFWSATWSATGEPYDFGKHLVDRALAKDGYLTNVRGSSVCAACVCVIAFNLAHSLDKHSVIGSVR